MLRTMRYAIISDSHANLVALKAVVEDVELRGVDEVIVAGDLVQGGPDPSGVLDLLVDRGWPAVLGNADELLLTVADGLPRLHDEPPAVWKRAEWTVDQLGPDRLDVLRALPIAIRRPLPAIGDLVVVHATPWSVWDVVAPDAPEADADRMLHESGASVVAYGHIHNAYQRRTVSGLLLSVGAVSLSNDRDPRPAYTVLTVADGTVTAMVHRVDVSPDEQAAAMLQVGQTPPDSLHTGGPWAVRAAADQPVQFRFDDC
jgi:predicted phosphodiesterase